MTNYDLLYDKDYYGELLYEDYFADKKLGYREIEHGTILPFQRVRDGTGLGGGILDEDGCYIESTSLHTGFGVPYETGIITEQEHTSAVIYLGMFHGIWGHCLTDNIRRLWFLKTEAYQKKFSSCPLVYIPLGDFQFHENFKELLEILGFDCSRFLPVRQTVKYQRIILPDESFFTLDGGRRYFTAEYRDFINCIREYGIKNQRPVPYRNVYFSYASYKRFKQIGEKRIEEYLKQQGYSVIEPEKLTFKEQLNILVQCENFASTIGSCSHNLIFLKDHTRVLLIPRANYLTGYQLALDQVHDLNITYADSSLSLFAAKSPWDGPFYYFISDRLMEYFKDRRKRGRRYWLREFRDFGIYILYGLHYGQGANADAYRYYSSAAAECLDQYMRADKRTRVKRLAVKAWLFLKQFFEMKNRTVITMMHGNKSDGYSKKSWKAEKKVKK